MEVPQYRPAKPASFQKSVFSCSNGVCGRSTPKKHDEKCLLYPADLSEKIKIKLKSVFVSLDSFFFAKKKERFEADILAGRPTANQNIWFKSPIAKSGSTSHPPTPRLHHPFFFAFTFAGAQKRRSFWLIAEGQAAGGAGRPPRRAQQGCNF